jgi:hypothetical protein
MKEKRVSNVVAGGADPGRSECNHLLPAGVTAPGYNRNSA